MSDVTTNPKSEDPNQGVTWGALSAVAVVVAVFVAAQLFAGLIITIYPRLKGWSGSRISDWVNNSIGAEFFYVLLAEVITIALVVWFIRWRKGSLRAIGLKRASWQDVPYAVLGYISYLVIYIFVVGFLTAFLKGLNVNQSQQLGYSQTTSGLALVPIFISLVILPAVTEEFLFRGFLFSGLKKAMPKVWAIIITSLIFASPHLLESGSGGLLWIAGIDTFVLSLVLCWVREKTGRLYAGMGIHALKNTVAFISLFLLHVH